jgi:hypothetical protein
MAEDKKACDHASLGKQSGIVTGYVQQQSKRSDEKSISLQPYVRDLTAGIYPFLTGSLYEREEDLDQNDTTSTLTAEPKKPTRLRT